MERKAGVASHRLWFYTFCCRNIVCRPHLLHTEESFERRSPGATELHEEESAHHISLSVAPDVPPSPPLPRHGPCLWLNVGILSRRLLVAKRAILRKAGQMHVGQSESEGGFSFFCSLLFFPSSFFFCSSRLCCSFLAPSTLTSEKITLICVGAVYYSLLRGPLRCEAESYWLINFSFCVSTSFCVSVCVCVWLVLLTHRQTKCSAWRRTSKKDL